MIKKEFAITVETIPGQVGEFTVLYKNQVIAQKEQDFPGAAGVIRLLHQKLDDESS